jgi:hypothetical protein
MSYEAKKAPTITLEREAVPLIFDTKEGAYLPAPYTGKKSKETTPTPLTQDLPGYKAFRSTDYEAPTHQVGDKEADYKRLVFTVSIIGALGMGMLVVRTLYFFSPFLTVVLAGAGILYVVLPKSKMVEDSQGAEPKVPRKTPRRESHEEEEEITVFYYKSKKITKIK